MESYVMRRLGEISPTQRQVDAPRRAARDNSAQCAAVSAAGRTSFERVLYAPEGRTRVRPRNWADQSLTVCQHITVIAIAMERKQ
ncbi:unnamed protein product, partial [Iphiclides podalirius]